MIEQQTCGKVLADRSALPAKFGELIAAMIENLEAHQGALEVTDENGKPELHAYVKLSQEFRCIATQLQATAAHMAGYRDLPWRDTIQRRCHLPKSSMRSRSS